MELNSREWATIIWFVVLLAFVLYKTKGKLDIGPVLDALFKRVLVTFLALLLAYVVLAILLLAHLDLWEAAQLKTTFLWFFFVATASAFRVTKKEPGFVRAWITDNLKIVVVLQFLLGRYTLSLGWELLLVPFAALLVGMSVFATEPQHRSVRKLVDNLLFIIGIWLVVRGVGMAIADLVTLTKPETVRDFYTEPLLSLSLLPFLNVAFIYVSYEGVFDRLQFFIPDADVRSFARHKAWRAFGPNIRLLNRWFRSVMVDRPMSRKDIEALIDETWDAASREKYPRAIPLTEGWCPYKAITFLKGDSLKPEQYRRHMEGDYFASASKSIELSFPCFANLNYYIEGNMWATTQLQVQLFVNNTTSEPGADAQFFAAAGTLLTQATGIEFSADGLAALCAQRGSFTENAEVLVIDYEVRSWDQHGTGFERKLRLRHVNHVEQATMEVSSSAA